MALVLGTSYGFVTEAPVDDPNDTLTTIDNRSRAVKDTSPATAAKITEIGWWCDTATPNVNFEMGLYSDAGNDEPEVRLHIDNTNAKGTTAGWKRVTGLNWEISPNTVYWLAIQLDNTSTTSIDYSSASGTATAYLAIETSLRSDWGTSNSTDTSARMGVYAVWEAAEGGINPKVKAGGAFATKVTKVKIGGSFAEKPVLVKVSGTFQ